MIIRVGADGALELRQADDFKGFHIEAELANSDRTSLIAAIAPIGRSDGVDFWIDIEKLKQLSGRQLDPHWAKRFHTMLAFAKQFGWINEDGTEVRCHVKPLPE